MGALRSMCTHHLLPLVYKWGVPHKAVAVRGGWEGAASE